MTQIVFQDSSIFRYLFSTIARFVDQVHFEIGSEGIRIKSIDPHDFCYLDLLMLKNFFRDYEVDRDESFGIDISKLRSFLPKISKAKHIAMKVNDNSLDLIASKDWNMIFSIVFLEKDIYNLPEPDRVYYDSYVVLNAKEFSNLVDAASTISSELIFSIEGKDFIIKSNSGDYSFTGNPSQILEFDGKLNKIETFVIASYLSYLTPLIKRCDRIRVQLGNGKPVRFDLMYRDKATFSFILSQRRRKVLRVKIQESRGGTSLPRLTISKLPEFLLYLSTCTEGESTRVLVAAGLETTGGDYSRMAIKLGLATRRDKRLHITRDGESFINLLKNDPKYSKQFLHKLASSEIEAYEIMLSCLREKPLAPDELFLEINRKLGEARKHRIDKQDLNTLLGLGIWCGIVDRKLALYYFGDSDE